MDGPNCDNSRMEIKHQCVVALTWVLKDTLGEELDVLDDPVEFLVGGNDLLARIEEALQGHRVGDTLALHLEPEDAFGLAGETSRCTRPAGFPAASVRVCA